MDEVEERRGDLASALRASAAAVIVERGLGGFSLREVARRAGVSHAAPGYQFGDMRGLLTSLAAEGFETLHRSVAEAAAGSEDSIERLIAVGKAYVQVAQRNPGHLAVMFRDDLIDSTDPVCAVAGHSAYTVLEDAVRAVARDHRPDLDIADAARACWSAMQGLVQLEAAFARIDAVHDRSTPTIDDAVERITRLIVHGLIHDDRPPG